MKLKIISDLHVEFGEPRHLNTLGYSGEDVLVCAGDVSNRGMESLYWLRDKFSNTRIVFVPGNHEYYSGEPISESNIDMLGYGKSLGIDVLINDSVEIDGIEFIGSTLWSNFDDQSGDSQCHRWTERYVNDFRMINVNDTQRLSAFHVQHKLFSAAYSFLHAKLHSDNQDQIVVTHFAPSRGSIAPQFRGDPITPYFVNDLDELVTKKPLIWIHGHTHTAFDYNVGESRVICNPSGYRGECSRFNPNLIVEV